MDNSIYSLASGVNANLNKMKVTSNNVANTNTDGHKRDFVILMRKNHEESLIDKEHAMPLDVSTVTDFSEGSIKMTNSPLDIAIRDKGFFIIEHPAGLRYTRYGSFKLNAQNELVTQQGYRVLSDGGAPIAFNENDTAIQMAQDGTIFTKDDKANFTALAKIGIAVFDDMSTLRKEGNTLFVSSTQHNIMEYPELVHSALEESNANSMREMQNLVEIQRDFESQNQLINQMYKTYKEAQTAFVKQG